MQVVDHIKPLAISENEGMNELTTLRYLATGIFWLAKQVGSIESAVIEHEHAIGKKVSFFGFGFLPRGAEELLPCYFHWFGTSLCNYARLVGFLGGLNNGVFDRSALEDATKFNLIKSYCDDYFNSITELSPVKHWRNKIFAHFAITDPRKNDNVALLESSVMYPVGYYKNRFRVSLVVVGKSDSSGIAHESNLESWSVTEVFDLIGARYWPHWIQGSPNNVLQGPAATGRS